MTSKPAVFEFIDTVLNNIESLKKCTNTYPACTPKYSQARQCCDTTYAEALKHYNDPPKIVDNVTVFTMPGLGDTTNDRCGQWVNPLKCPNYKEERSPEKEFNPEFKFVHEKRQHKHDRFVVQHHCHNLNCPICYTNAAKRQSHTVTEKLLAGHKLYKNIGINLGNFKHWVFSPDQEEGIGASMDLEEAKELRRLLYEQLRIAGVLGAVVIYHPFRQNDPEDKIGGYRYDLAPYAWYPSPHFHIVGCGYLIKSDKFYKKTGWVYKLIRQIDPADIESVESVIKYIVGYQSSHCGITKGWQSVTYFGLFHSKKLRKASVKKTRDPIKCRLCGEALHSHQLVLDEHGDMDWKNAADTGVFYRTKKQIIYEVRPGLALQKQLICRFQIADAMENKQN